MIRGVQKLAKDMSFRILRQDAVASNLANAATPGFKTQRTFISLLKDKLGLGRTGEEGEQSIGLYTSFEQGSIEQTHRSLDLAIDGEGFFVIETAYGERFTRCGSFTLTDGGFLATHAGDTVLGTGGPILIDGQDLNITPDGRVVVDGEEVGSLKLVRFEEPQKLTREGNMFAAPGQSYSEVDFRGTQIVQGALENSNVSPIDEMVEMIAIHRGFESSQKSITLLDESAKQLIERAGDFGRR